MITLDNINKGSGISRKKRKLGRGKGSGAGTYSGKGIKGQKARSGVSRGKLKRLGMRQTLLRVPKLRGFNSPNQKDQVVNIGAINQSYKDNEVVNPETLLAKKLISKANLPVKILGQGELSLKGLKFEKVKMSASVKKMLEK